MAEAGLALAAPAKINLALHVTGRRGDGFHILDSLAVFARHGDRVTLSPAGALTLSVEGPFAAHAPGDGRDLAWRAAEAFFLRTGAAPKVAIRIAKNIPAGAGLGGGSADAAAVLRGLNRMTGAGLAEESLAALGLALGADVPMCLASAALRATGIGEKLLPLADWPELPLVLVWPGRPVPTAACFAALGSRDNPGLPAPSVRTPDAAADWLSSCRNDLEEPALRLLPDIAEVLGALRATSHCRLARMSGSGSACFGIYGSTAQAEAAAQVLRAAHPAWWVVDTVAS